MRGAAVRVRAQADDGEHVAVARDGRVVALDVDAAEVDPLRRARRARGVEHVVPLRPEEAREPAPHGAATALQQHPFDRVVMPRVADRGAPLAARELERREERPPLPQQALRGPTAPHELARRRRAARARDQRARPAAPTAARPAAQRGVEPGRKGGGVTAQGPRRGILTVHTLLDLTIQLVLTTSCMGIDLW